MADMSASSTNPPLRKPVVGESAAIGQEAERIRVSGMLGEARLRQLFDYLVMRSVEGQSPKEIAIAIDVFGKHSGFDVSQDALVRVYIHKLRKVLDDFYSSRDGTVRAHALHIPRGEYRLRLVLRTPPPIRRKVLTVKISLAVLSTAVLLGVAVLIAFGAVWLRIARSDLELARASPIWSAVLNDNRPIMIVMGDYYLIGETDSSLEVKRLVREYSVNSKSDLDSYVEQHPEFADRYVDVGLRYLPVSAAYALRYVMAVLTPENRRVIVTKMSDVEASSFKSADIVYIGYLSGMGILQDLVLTGSRFAIGDSYDEIIDKSTRHSYISQAGPQHLGPPQLYGSQTPYRDYGLFATFRGPGGNSIVVISGTRDEGVQQTAEAFTSPEKLAELSRQTDTSQPFEALLEVNAIDGTNLGGKLLLESTRGYHER
jgi:hypothetical protein